jgi:hypothetical protein
VRIEPVDHDLGAEVVQFRPASGEWPGEIVDHADLQYLGGLVSPNSGRRKQQRRYNRPTHKACEPMKDH